MYDTYIIQIDKIEKELIYFNNRGLTLEDLIQTSTEIISYFK